MIPALAFVPEDAVGEAFESMTDQISTNTRLFVNTSKTHSLALPSLAFIFGICMTVLYKSIIALITT